MSESSHGLDPRSRKTQAVLLHRLAVVGLGPVATTLGVDDSTVSRTNWERIALTLTALGLKVVPVGSHTVSDEDFEYMRKATIERLSQPREGDTGIDWGVAK